MLQSGTYHVFAVGQIPTHQCTVLERDDGDLALLMCLGQGRQCDTFVGITLGVEQLPFDGYAPQPSGDVQIMVLVGELWHRAELGLGLGAVANIHLADVDERADRHPVALDVEL